MAEKIISFLEKEFGFENINFKEKENNIKKFKETIIIILDSLTEKEKIIFKSYYINNEKVENIAEKLDISKARIYQIKQKMNRKLRHPIRAVEIKRITHFYNVYKDNDDFNMLEGLIKENLKRKFRLEKGKDIGIKPNGDFEYEIGAKVKLNIRGQSNKFLIQEREISKRSGCWGRFYKVVRATANDQPNKQCKPFWVKEKEIFCIADWRKSNIKAK